MKVGIIDYGGGNLQSVANAFKAVGTDSLSTAGTRRIW